ncbi:ubiquitin [Gilbertella persicaria]|uniref:ubiquitin n=1 Tax=Gilbertella persicaria TaxID=101096 RepID=UPI0022207CC2|nr:ubiquitin [Gilbertella persicaria]KAI8070566.1 ubiquitin [Gilbertella persicaria]
MQIFIKALSGKTTTLHVQPTHTIQHIKQMLLATEGIPTECVMLIYGGKQLVHHHYTLEQYHIKNESVMYLVVRLPGGKIND